ncbi:MAG TPA: YihY/virulence factor BrkB family protein [Lachnospiraceae bacterium]|nr:YihY/virulence factor BrkB family protein [Lachnospiraceae bacterium]
MIRKIFRVISRFGTSMKENNTSSFAAGTAFFTFLSLIPILIMICSILPFTNATQEVLVNLLDDFLPMDVIEMCRQILEEIYDKSVAVISVSAIATIWAAGKCVFSLMNGLNAVNKVIEKRNFFVLRIWSSIYTIAFILMTVFSLVIMVYGNVVNDLLIKKIPDFHVILQVALHFRFVFVWAFFTLFFQIIYTIMPNKKMKFREQFPGALCASIGWSVFSGAFSIYVNSYNAFSMYGSLTTIIVGMMWLYFCMYIIFVGAQINVYFQPAFHMVSYYHVVKKRERKERKLEDK